MRGRKSFQSFLTYLGNKDEVCYKCDLDVDVPARMLRTAVRKFQLSVCAAPSPDKTEKQAPVIGINGADTIVLEYQINLFPASLLTGVGNIRQNCTRMEF